MSQTIKRGGKGARKVAAAQGKARQVRAAKARTGSVLDAVMSWLPFSDEQLQKGFLYAILGGAALLAWGVASYAGVTTMARQQIDLAVADMGFAVHRVEVRGVKHLNELKIYERALDQRDQAMSSVDIEGLRQELLALSWVEDARVSRQLPETLVIDIVERKPLAVLRKADRLVLIDATGTELEVVSAAKAKGRLVLSGPGARQQVAALMKLLEAAPALKPQVREAEWIGNRRWNLTFKTGQVLALPEGEARSSGALIKFARLDGVNRLLGGKVAAFDMRAADRIYMRVPGRTDAVETKGTAAAAKPAEAVKTAAAANSGDAAKEERE